MGNAALMGSLTLLSRVLGLVRDMVIAWLLGTGFQADAYGVAIKLPNMFRRLMGEGAMSAAYVPVLSSLLHGAEGDPGKGREVWRFVSRFTYIFTLTLLLLTAAGIAFTPGVVRVVAPGFVPDAGSGHPDPFRLTVTLTRIVFPYLFFVCLAALAMGTLNALRSFGPPAFTPVLLNLSIILCALFLRDAFPLPVHALAVGYLAGGVLQVAWQVPFLARRGARLYAVAPVPGRHVLRVGRRMGIGAVGAGIYQINAVVGTMVASTLPRGSISSLYYADRLNEVVLGVWAVSVATVVLPSLARLRAAGNEEGARRTLSLALRMVLFLTVPAAVGLSVLARPIVGTLFQRGAFDVSSLALTTSALAAFAVGLPAVGGARVLISAFYAREDVARAVSVAAVSFAVNLALLAAFYTPLAHAGVALAGSGAAWTSCAGLALWYRRSHGRLGGRAVAASAARVVIASAVMAAALVLLGRLTGEPHHGLNGALYLCVSIPSGAAVYLGACRLLRSPEIREFSAMLRRKVRPT